LAPSPRFYPQSRAEPWLELTEQAFDFATYAHSAFLKDDLQVKREIMLALGSNRQKKAL